MKSTFRMATRLACALCCLSIQIACHAQSAAPATERAPLPPLSGSKAQRVDNLSLLAATGEEKPVDPASLAASASTPAPSDTTTNASATVAAPPTNDAIIKELAEMKARITLLEAELKSRDGAAVAERDANALRIAEGSAASGGSSSSLTPALQAATVTPAPPAPKEISAQTTTKGEPFEGDWTWLNSNGHAVDSPMATKYFTPEFRADANYILDYNHPHDDTMGGATESFRSDEWQLDG